MKAIEDIYLCPACNATVNYTYHQDFPDLSVRYITVGCHGDEWTYSFDLYEGLF